LIVSLKNFYNQHKLIEPYSYPKNQKNIITIKQHKLERMLLNNVYECILCACCSSSCPSYCGIAQTILDLPYYYKHIVGFLIPGL